MSYSKAITEEDLRNILNEVLPPKGIDHLYHYTTPTANGYSFSANQYRKITVSLSTTYAGFTPLIVRGQCTSHSTIRVFNYYLDGSSLVFEALSQSSAAISGANFAFTVLWLNNNFF